MVITDFEAVTTKPIFSHWFYDVTIDANNNKVLAGGEAMSPGPDNWEYLAMARYDSNGALYDPTFNSGQPLLQDWHSSFIHSLRVDSKGRILACGSSGPYFACWRYLNSGAADPIFGKAKSGWLTTAFGAGSQDAYAMVRQSDGKFVVGGLKWITTVIKRNQSTTKPVFALARYYED